jgi:hypothetical protein
MMAHRSQDGHRTVDGLSSMIDGSSLCPPARFRYLLASKSPPRVGSRKAVEEHRWTNRLSAPFAEAHGVAIVAGDIEHAMADL